MVRISIIWEDAWIPSSPSRKILTPRGRIVYTKISELIDPDTRTWDEELLRELFITVDVSRIMKIPLAIGESALSSPVILVTNDSTIGN